jgi:chromosome condensin MukBEF complex kleisin-like MukF subunit
MTNAEFFKVHLLRVGSARAIAELERDLIAIQKRLEQEDKVMDEIGSILIDSWSAKDRHVDQFFIMRDCRRIFHERNRRQVQEQIKGVLEMGPIKGTESIPWDNPDVRLKSLEELFPEYCGDK